jgi:sortase A
VAISYIDGMMVSRAALDAFAARADAAASDSFVSEPGAPPDQSDWSEQRKAAYAESLGRDVGVPEAVLAIPDLRLEVPVFGSTKRLALNRGVGLVEGTARPGEDGNIAIAGHRDGFFRPLKDVQVGASIELRTLQGTRRYRVHDILIVDPLDGSVLKPTAEPMLTLITCYPFYYVGYAPDRYIVRATLEPGTVEKELRTAAEQ